MILPLRPSSPIFFYARHRASRAWFEAFLYPSVPGASSSDSEGYSTPTVSPQATPLASCSFSLLHLSYLNAVSFPPSLPTFLEPVIPGFFLVVSPITFSLWVAAVFLPPNWYLVPSFLGALQLLSHPPSGYHPEPPRPAMRTPHQFDPPSLRVGDSRLSGCHCRPKSWSGFSWEHLTRLLQSTRWRLKYYFPSIAFLTLLPNGTRINIPWPPALSPSCAFFSPPLTP